MVRGKQEVMQIKYLLVTARYGQEKIYVCLLLQENIK